MSSFYVMLKLQLTMKFLSELNRRFQPVNYQICLESADSKQGFYLKW